MFSALPRASFLYLKTLWKHKEDCTRVHAGWVFGSLAGRQENARTWDKAHRNRKVAGVRCAAFIMLLLLLSTCRILIDFQHAVYLSIFNMQYTYRFSTCRIPIDFQHAVYLLICNMPYTYRFSTCRILISTCRIFNMLFKIEHAVCSFLAWNMPFWTNIFATRWNLNSGMLKKFRHVKPWKTAWASTEVFADVSRNTNLFVLSCFSEQ